jgi:hypothetical protein
MGRYVFAVATRPVAGRDAEYNKWYDEIHLADVCAFPGFVGAKRYRTSQPDEGASYLALYEMESDDPMRDFNALSGASGTDRMRMSDALDADSAKVVLWEEITVYRPKKG